MTNVPKNFLGYAKSQLVASPNTETSVPTLVLDPRNPANNIYFTGINKLGSIASFVRGRNTPALQQSTYLHSSFTSAALLASYITSFDSNNDSNAYNWQTNDGTSGQSLSTEVFGGCRCAAMSIAGMNTGPVSLDMAWLAQTANSNASFSAYTPITGQCYDAAITAFNGGADTVDGYRINILRGQAYNMMFNPGSYDPLGVDSGMIGGTLELIQSPLATTVPVRST